MKSLRFEFTSSMLQLTVDVLESSFLLSVPDLPYFPENAPFHF